MIEFQSVLQDVVKYRQFTAEAYVPTRCSNGITEYLPWTAATGKHGLRNSLNQMVKMEYFILKMFDE